MKSFIGVVLLVLFAASMASAFEVQKLYLEGVNQIEGNVLSGMDTPREWDLNAVFKADVLELPGLVTLGARVDVSYTPDNSFDSVGLATEVYIKPFGLNYIELGARHSEQNVSDLNFNDGYSAFFRMGIGL
jgi:hypothetical protein